MRGNASIMSDGTMRLLQRIWRHTGWRKYIMMIQWKISCTKLEKNISFIESQEPWGTILTSMINFG